MLLTMASARPASVFNKADGSRRGDYEDLGKNLASILDRNGPLHDLPGGLFQQGAGDVDRPFH